jgi:DNA-directed RNA polymerase subunit RPC12/RpoP
VGSDTLVRRSREKTLLWASLAVGSASSAIALFVSSHGVIGAIAILFSIIFLIFLAGGSNAADCPQCGARVFGVLPLPNACKNCGSYVMVRDQHLVETPEDFVSDEHDFKANIDRLMVGGTLSNLSWPQMCSICSKRPSRREELTVTRGPAGFGTEFRWRFQIPHCSEHSKGVEADGVRFGFRSHRYWKDFCASNRLNPNDAMST